MKIILYLFCLFLPVLCFSQKGKKNNGTSIYVSTTFNYYPAIAPYSFFSSFSGTTSDDVILNYLTRTGGTFTIEEGESIVITRENTSEFPSQILGLGASLQLLKESGLFHEFSLTKLSFAKSSYHTEFIFIDALDEMTSYHSGYDQKTAAIAFRYEIGKYFGKSKRSKLKFGLSGGIEPSFYFYKRTNYSINAYPMKANIQTIDLSVIPMLSAKLSKKISLDFKVISNILIADFGSFTEGNPMVSLDQQNGEREYSLPEISMAFSIVLRYKIKEPKKGRRR